VPVAGRPAFLRLTVIDFAIITYNVKASRGEAWTSAPALTRATTELIQMTQADSVHSTPPTNTPKITPVDTTRRHLLTVAAGGAVAALVSPALATPAADPIFAAIDAFCRVDAEYMAFEGPNDIPDELGDRQWNAYKAVLRTRPTTLGGLAALTSFARERSEWLLANSSIRSHEDEREVFAAIDDATRGMSGLEPWSPRLDGKAVA
jgi:hypothetical protein